MNKVDLSNMNNIKIWLDDVREVPEGYVLAKSVDEAIALIEQIEALDKEIEVIDLDHDLGDYAPYVGMALIFWIILLRTKNSIM